MLELYNQLHPQNLNTILLIALAAMLAFALLIFFQKAKTWGAAPYHRGRFLSENEKAFFRVIKLAAGQGYHVCMQVRLADLVQINNSLNERGRLKALYRVSSKSIDFLLVSASSLDLVLAIELDDRSHLRAGRQVRDVFVNQVFHEIGVPLLRVRAKMNYNLSELKAALITYGIPYETDSGMGRIKSS